MALLNHAANMTVMPLFTASMPSMGHGLNPGVAGCGSDAVCEFFVISKIMLLALMWLLQLLNQDSV
jgi:hypothetical protein